MSIEDQASKNADSGRAVDAQFDAWRDSLPATYWARYDLSACRLGWDAAIAAQASPAAVPNADTARLDWLERHPRLGEFVINGQSTDCFVYAVTGAPCLKLREIIDAAMRDGAKA